VDPLMSKAGLSSPSESRTSIPSQQLNSNFRARASFLPFHSSLQQTQEPKEFMNLVLLGI
jgi:hypothetical protein